MASRKFVVVDRDIFAFRFSAKELRKKFSGAGTERVTIQADDYGYDTLGVTKDGDVLWDDGGGVSFPPHVMAWDALERVQERAKAELKQARKDLKVCRKIRQALEETREFGRRTGPASPFSGLLKRGDD
jgi:hypothetical protein